jgi:hydrogenase maturation protease
VGVRVAEALASNLPPGVALRTRTGDMLGLIDDWAGYEHVLCIDAAAPMAAPGRIHRIDTAREPLPTAPGLSSSHGIGIAEALALARTIGKAPEILIVFAVEGASFEVGAPLTPTVAGVVAEVAERVRTEAASLMAMREAAHA